jgi:MoaA/NifB/PqqE/SkfB family radical SAM enzyme
MTEWDGPGVQALNFVWLEITGKCQLACEHCYAESGPWGTHGVMTFEDWTQVIDQCAELGVSDVQFIGGEPTLHPRLVDLVGYALGRALTVEVFSNLVHVTPAMWEVFSRPGVSLATSYYSDDPGQHDAITTHGGSHRRTRANIAEAARRAIPLRAGVIDLREGQRVTGALAQLAGLGVADTGVDGLRQVGRGQREASASVDQLCGNCATGVLAISPDGTVWPCVFTRWLPVGNARLSSLAEILDGSAVADVRAMLDRHFHGEPRCGCEEGPDEPSLACNPDCNPNCRPTCNPNCRPRCAPSCHPSCNPACQPNCAPRCGPSCQPCAPFRRCWPSYH